MLCAYVYVYVCVPTFLILKHVTDFHETLCKRYFVRHIPARDFHLPYSNIAHASLEQQ
jgi:hypothetical protein